MESGGPPGPSGFSFRDRVREISLDLSGLKCPLPALRTRKALRGLGPGDVLVVTCTDPLATLDVPNLVRETGDVLEAVRAVGAAAVFRIRRAGA